MTIRPDVVVIGEAPGRDNLFSRPLFGINSWSAGGRLRDLAGLTRAEWNFHVTRVNLIAGYPGDRWPLAEARASAANMSYSLLRDRRLILCGRRVAGAFLLTPRDYDWCRWTRSPLGPEVGVIPHPSGRCQLYNDPGNRTRVRRFLRRALLSPE